MFGILRKLSSDNQSDGLASSADVDVKSTKRHRSGATINDASSSKQKQKRFSKSSDNANTGVNLADKEDGEFDFSGNEDSADCAVEPNPDNKDIQEDNSTDRLPTEMLEWGIKLFELIQKEFKSVANSVGTVERSVKKNSKSIDKIEKKLAGVELWNKELETENINLKERLLDIEYRQKCNNLIFEGVLDCDGESDTQIINKVRSILKHIPGLDQSLVIDKCHQIDGAFKPTRSRRVMCTFNWYVDVQLILRNRKHLPKGIYVNEDFPEEWIDRRKVLKPIYNAAKRNEKLKHKTHLSRDKLVIDGQTFAVGPGCNLGEVNKILDVQSTCEHSDTADHSFPRVIIPL